MERKKEMTEYIPPQINQIGGKYRLRKKLEDNTPFHDYFQTLFAGSCVYEVNKPKAYKYECFNDIDNNYINYFEVIRDFPKEFDFLKTGTLGLLSQFVFERMRAGKTIPKNKIENAYYFYYSNKLGFGGSGTYDYNLIKEMGLAYFNLSLVSLYKWNIAQLKALKLFNPDNSKAIGETIKNIRGLIKAMRIQAVNYFYIPGEKVDMNYRGITLPTVCKSISTKESIEYYKQISRIFPNFRGLSPKTTRPISNADGGLLTEVDPKLIERLQFINLTSYDFRKAYKRFLKAFYTEKGLTKECFIYADPPYPSTEQYYTIYRFTMNDHYDLINIMKETPFHFLTSIGGECKFYIDEFKDLDNWKVIPVKIKYCTSAKNQIEKTEYMICNYDIKKTPKMRKDNKQKTIESFFSK